MKTVTIIDYDGVKWYFGIEDTVTVNRLCRSLHSRRGEAVGFVLHDPVANLYYSGDMTLEKSASGVFKLV